jgi:hypothetical protein
VDELEQATRDWLDGARGAPLPVPELKGLRLRSPA